ncbi:MAG: pyridoxamine 5'-phosphate oxidase [Cyanobacteriota bacterium]
MELFDYRKDYTSNELLEENLEKNPFKQFEKWFKEAEIFKIFEPNAFNLASCDKTGKLSSRIILLKEFSDVGFTFFTNYESKKASQIVENTNVAINFFWGEMQRQIRIEGVIEKIAKDKSEEYFRMRPRESQIGALVSKQSAKLSSRKELDDKYLELENFYKDKEIPFPENWGGYIIKPNYFEFWQGRTSRLHDRITFEKNETGWDFFRLSP